MSTIAEKLSSIAEKSLAIFNAHTSAKQVIADSLVKLSRIPANESETLTSLAQKVSQANESWRPDPLWPTLDDVEEGEIGFIVRDTNEYGDPARNAFYVATNGGNYIVDWGDGTVESYLSATSCVHTYVVGGGTPDSSLNTVYKVIIRAETTSLQRFQSFSILGKDLVPSSILYANINAPTVTTLSSAFYDHHLLEAVRDIYIPGNCAVTYCFNNCTSLRKVGNITLLGSAGFALTYFFGSCSLLKEVGDITVPRCTNFYGMFQYCTNLRSVGVISSAYAIGAYCMFQNCVNLESIAGLYMPLAADLRYMLISTYNLKYLPDLSNIGNLATVSDGLLLFTYFPRKGSINMPNTKFSKLEILGTSVRYCGATSLSFSPESPFTGTSPQVNIQYTSLDRQALIDVFNLLPALSRKTINITGSIGASDLTVSDRQIATGKGWTIVG